MMPQDLNSIEQQLMRWFLVGLALLSAIFVGVLIATQQVKLLGLLAGVAVLLTVMIGMQRKAWMLIPLAWIVAGSSPILGLPFSMRQIAIMLAACSYIACRVISNVGFRQKRHPLDVLLFLNLGWFLVTFIVHPVGFRAFGTGTVGGRPYIETAFAAIAYWVLVRLPNSAKSVSRIPFLMLASSMFVTGLQVIGYVFPGAVPYLYGFYSGFDLEAFFHSDTIRWKGLSDFGMGIVPVLCAYFRPRTLFNPLRLWFYLLVLGLGCILASGFRNRLLWAVATVVIAALFHRGWRDLLVATVLGAVLLGGLIAGQGRLYDLPLGMQRTLTFLPGNWEPSVVADAEVSTEWRFELWKTVIREGVIKNWWCGDGLGVSVEELATLHTGEGWTETALRTGTYHSGPLTAIRYAGVIGLVLFYTLMFVAAVSAARCVQRCRGTSLFPASIFVATQLIWYPLHNIFVFGSYDLDLPEVIFLTALLRLLIRMTHEIAIPATNLVSAPIATTRASTLVKVGG
jgi:hypothetical protein